MSADLVFSVPAKVILTGEHSVLRGHSALVVPFSMRRLDLIYRAKKVVAIDSVPSSDESVELLLLGVLERALGLLGRKRDEDHGAFEVRNTIPIGAGLGFSAALCVAVTRWLVSRGWLSVAEGPEFARKLENMFHGESSGLDIAVAWRCSPIEFQRGQEPISLELTWHPPLYVSYSGQRGLTSECVKRVKNLIATDPGRGGAIDQDMAEATDLAKVSLTSPSLSQEERARKLRESFFLAKSCFVQWGLTEGVLDNHLRRLETAGAVAVKPTGSGGGGHALSFWRKPPSSAVCEDLGLMPLFESQSFKQITSLDQKVRHD